jgi:two-component system phosphate regulon response regulator PhoB
MKSHRTTDKNTPGPVIFIVEDDKDIASLIDHTMQRSGFRTRIFRDGRDVVEAAHEQLPALVLLDLMLPGEDGMEILHRLESKQQTRAIGKIILSARGSELDKVRALELGADDYVTKPFSPRELILRVQAVLRSLPGDSQQHRIIRVGNLVADLDARTVTAGDRMADLTATEFNLLIHLMLHPGRTLTRDQILDSVWPLKSSIESRIVDVYVRRIRERIEADPSNPQRLVTRRGGGYSLIDPHA